MVIGALEMAVDVAAGVEVVTVTVDVGLLLQVAVDTPAAVDVETAAMVVGALEVVECERAPSADVTTASMLSIISSSVVPVSSDLCDMTGLVHFLPVGVGWFVKHLLQG